MKRRGAAALTLALLVAVAACSDSGEHRAARARPVNGDGSQAATGPLDTLIAAIAGHAG
jgi:type II secretory pathway component PulK